MAHKTAVTVFYGLDVQAADLPAAGMAAKTVRPALIALALICHRRERDTLHSSPSAAFVVERVPPEVRGEVRRLLIRTAVGAARVTVL